jgi:hypothetical protein
MDWASSNLGAEPSDSDDIRWALETASAMWAKGDHHEALRWLRRAAETASEEGADVRAVELAKMAADLRGQLALPQSEAPAAAPQGDAASAVVPHPVVSIPAAPARRSTPPPLPTSAPQPQAGPAVLNDEVFERAAEAILKSEPPPAAEWFGREASEAQAESPSSPESSRPSWRPIQPSSEGVRRISVNPAPPATSRAVRPSALPEVSSTMKSRVPIASAVQAKHNLTPVEKPARHHALRVGVKASPDANGMLIAKVLAPGERPPEGMKEAFFVPLEPGVDLGS